MILYVKTSQYPLRHPFHPPSTHPNSRLGIAIHRKPVTFLRRRLAIAQLQIIFQQYVTEYNLDRIRRKESTGTGVFPVAKGRVNMAGARERGKFSLFRVITHAEEAVRVEDVAVGIYRFVVPHEVVGEDDLGSFGNQSAVRESRFAVGISCDSRCDAER